MNYITVPLQCDPHCVHFHSVLHPFIYEMHWRLSIESDKVGPGWTNRSVLFATSKAIFPVQYYNALLIHKKQETALQEALFFELVKITGLPPTPPDPSKIAIDTVPWFYQQTWFGFITQARIILFVSRIGSTFMQILVFECSLNVIPVPKLLVPATLVQKCC